MALPSTSSNPSLPGPSASIRRWMWALTGIGFALSALLEHTHYRAYTAPLASSYCSIGERVDCASVALSSYSVVLGIPLPFWGMAGFAAIALALWQRSRWLLPLTAFAALASLGLVLVSAFGVGSFCLLCEGVHVVSLALVWLAWRSRGALTQAFAERESSALVLGPPLGLLIAATLLVPRYWGAFGWVGDVPFSHGKTAEGHAWIGATEPKLTIEEFVDYTCPHCKAASARHLRALARHEGELRIVRRQYPAMRCEPRRETRCLPLRMALCADQQDKFWQAERWLFEHASLRRAIEPAQAARDLRLDETTFTSCVSAPETFDQAQALWKAAKKLRLPGTPHYLVDGKAMSAADVEARIGAL